MDINFENGKNKCWLVLVCVFTISIKSFAQNLLFANAIDNKSNMVSCISDVNGNTFVAGNFRGNFSTTGDDIFIIKYNASGQQIWRKDYGGSGAEFVRKIKIDSQGNIFLIGDYTESCCFISQTLNNSGPKSQGFIVKLDNSGTRIWAKSFGGFGSEYCSDFVIDNAGYFIVLGTTDDDFVFSDSPINNIGKEDVFMAKFKPDGTPMVAKSYGSTESDTAFSIVCDNYDNCYFIGNFSGPTFFAGNFSLTNAGDNLTNDGFLLKTDNSGFTIWAKSFGNTFDDFIYGLSYYYLGSLFITGSFSNNVNLDAYSLNSIGGKDGYIAKLDMLGNVVWAKKFGSFGDDSGLKITNDLYGNSYLTGLFSDTITLGEISHISFGLKDIFISRLDWNGNFKGSVAIQGSGTEIAEDITLDNVQNVVICGNFSDTMQIGNRIFNNDNIRRGFMAKFSKSALVSTKDVEDADSILVNIFPNPIEKNNFKFFLYASSSLEIYNLLGELVFEKKLESGEHTIATNFTTGIYIAKFKFIDNFICEKIVVN